jgi:uncharacterized membrane protein
MPVPHHSEAKPSDLEVQPFTAAELGAIAHLYRGEVYRSTIWRTRLDNTTNWSVVTLGIALSITFSRNDATPLPLILVGILIVGFLGLEARRYRYFNVWRARTRWMEKHFYAPMLSDGEFSSAEDWRSVLARDYRVPQYHISYMRAVGRRLRRNYAWIFTIQAIAYYGKITVHPSALETVAQLWTRAAVGPIPGQLMVAGGLAFYAALFVTAVWTYQIDRAAHRERDGTVAMG